MADRDSTDRMPKRDANQKAAQLVRKVTGTGPVRGEDLLADPELQRQLREAKAREKKAQRKQT